MPLRGRTRISSTGVERSGESTIRASSTTMPLTLRSWLNMLFIGRFLVACLSWSKTSYPESAPSLTPSLQRLNDEPTPTKTAKAPKNSKRITSIPLLDTRRFNKPIFGNPKKMLYSCLEIILLSFTISDFLRNLQFFKMRP